MVNAHGLAAEIRSADSDETFDLGGMNETSIVTTMKAAFGEALPFNNEDGGMIRLTFVVGAGKQARQRYDANATKALTSVLNDCGYVQDKAASGVLDCAGAYKLQHDTGKNLKTVVVYPQLKRPSGGNGEDGKAGNSAPPPLIPTDEPRYKLGVSSMPVFRNMVTSKCPSWSQKKHVMEELGSLKEIMDGLDLKLQTGQPLDESEQAFYDNGVSHLDDKIDWVQAQMHEHVDTGAITATEREKLLQQNAERIAEKKGKVPPALIQRKQTLTDITPIPPQPLKHAKQIEKLQQELTPLLEFVQSTRGQLVSVKDAHKVARHDELLEEIEALEQASRGWFEDDDEFEARLEINRREYVNRRQKRREKQAVKANKMSLTTSISGRGGSSANSSGGSAPVSKWVVPGQKMQKNADMGSSFAGKKKKKGGKGSSVFGAVNFDDSSSSESDDDEDDEDVDEGDAQDTNEVVEQKVSKPVIKSPSPAKSTHSAPKDEQKDETPAQKLNESTGKKNKKKKKKKGGGNTAVSESATAEEPAVVSSRSIQTPESANDDGEKTQLAIIKGLTISFFCDLLWPILLALLSWLFSLVFGDGKKKGGKNSKKNK